MKCSRWKYISEFTGVRMALRRIQACIIWYALFSRSPIVQCELHRPTRATRREMRKTRRRMRCERSACAERVLALRLLFNTLRITCGCRGEQRSEWWAKKRPKEREISMRLPFCWMINRSTSPFRYEAMLGINRRRNSSASIGVCAECWAERPRERRRNQCLWKISVVRAQREKYAGCLFVYFCRFFSSFSFSFYISSTGKS